MLEAYIVHSVANHMLEGMRVRRSQSVNAPGFVLNIVEASFDGDGSTQLKVERPTLFVTFRGGSKTGLRRLRELRMTGSTPPGRLTLIPPGTVLHGWCGGRASSISFISAVFDPQVLETLCGIEGRGLELLPRLGAEDPDLVNAINLLRREVENGGLASSLLFESLAAMTTVFLLRNHSERLEEAAAPRSRGLSSNRLKVVKDYLEQNLSEDTTLAELAAMADLSTFHFCRAFKQATGRSPHRYRIERRVERAKQLLADPNYPVGAIAAACGFASASHFATTFSRMTGRSPSRFRREI